MKNIVLFFILATICISCSKKKGDEIYTLEEFDILAKEAKPYFEKGASTLKIADYAPGVKPKEAKTLVYERLAFYAIAFETTEQARNEAIRLNQYYARNWLFDRVEGEPILEDYVILTFKAVNPNRQIQRVPKKVDNNLPAAPHH